MYTLHGRLFEHRAEALIREALSDPFGGPRAVSPGGRAPAEAGVAGRLAYEQGGGRAEGVGRLVERALRRLSWELGRAS